MWTQCRAVGESCGTVSEGCKAAEVHLQSTDSKQKELWLRDKLAASATALVTSTNRLQFWDVAVLGTLVLEGLSS